MITEANWKMKFATHKLADAGYFDTEIKSVKEVQDEWSFTCTDGCEYSIPKSRGIVPLVGQVARFWGSRCGGEVHGLEIDGIEVFYVPLCLDSYARVHIKEAMLHKAY